MRDRTSKRREYPVDELLAERIRKLIDRFPTFGYRRLWAMLRRDGLEVNQKAVYRVLKLEGWFVHAGTVAL